QAGGNLNGDETQPAPALPQVRPNRLPERIGGALRLQALGIQPGRQLLGCAAGVVAPKPGTQLLGSPERGPVGRLVQHLRDPLAPSLVSLARLTSTQVGTAS